MSIFAFKFYKNDYPAMSESYIDEKTNIAPLDTSTTDDNEKRSDEHIGEENRKDLSKYFYFSSSVDDVPLHKYRDYCIHMFCVSGRAVARIGEKTFDIRPNDCVVLLNNHSFSWISISDDFVEHGMFISQKYLSLESPDKNYQTLGMLTLMDDPIVEMNEEEFNLCTAVCEATKERLRQTNHVYYREILLRCVETLFMDIFNVRAHRKGMFKQTNGNRGSQLFKAFISMLEKGTFKSEREVRWYAAKMKITPKYLSEVCINASGHGASYWINKFTTDEIARLLHNPTMPINSISDLMNFTTRSYFSHYVREHLGMTPKDYRLRILGMK